MNQKSLKHDIDAIGARILLESISSEPEPSSETTQLHKARIDIARFKHRRKVAELEKEKAESELASAKMTMKKLSSMIEETNIKFETRTRGVEVDKYAQVMEELEFVKQELSRLRIDMDFVLKEKKRAEEETEASNSKLSSSSRSVGEIKKKIEEMNEEHVIVELAMMEAVKEFGEIERKREMEATEFSAKLEERRKKIDYAMKNVEGTKELENALAVTMSDIDLLQTQIIPIKEMDLQVAQRKYSSTDSESSNKELEAANKELDSIRKEVFQFMSSMDIIRNELSYVKEEVEKAKKAEGKTELNIQKLNSKLLKMKSKLDSVTATEEQAKSVASNLAETLEHLRTEAAAAKREREVTCEEIAAIKAEVPKTESEIGLTELMLEAAMLELESVAASETSALEDLKNLIENANRVRNSTSVRSSTIRLSKFEYDYLTGRAVEAEEIADKKVAAAQAWTEALKASEKETLTKIEMAQREIREMKLEEQQVNRTERTKRKVEGEPNNRKQKYDENKEAKHTAFSSTRKSTKGNGIIIPPRRKFIKSSSLVNRMPRSTLLPVKKRNNMVPNLAKLFSGKGQDEK